MKEIIGKTVSRRAVYDVVVSVMDSCICITSHTFGEKTAEEVLSLQVARELAGLLTKAADLVDERETQARQNP